MTCPTSTLSSVGPWRPTLNFPFKRRRALEIDISNTVRPELLMGLRERCGAGRGSAVRKYDVTGEEVMRRGGYYN